MSLDISVRLYFSMTFVRPTLRALASILRGEPGKAIVVTIPDDESFAIPCCADSLIRKPAACLLNEETSIGADAYVSAVVRKKKKLSRRAKPRINVWGDVEDFEITQVRRNYPVAYYVARGWDYFEIGFHNITSSDVDFFYSKPFRARLAYLYSEGYGVAGVYDCMFGECWQSFSQPEVSLTLPDDFRADDLVVDEMVAILTNPL